MEFRMQRGGVQEYHQVKRQHGAEGRWTLKELGSRTVLSAFWDKLNDPAARCVFVSSHPAHQLGELIERAGDAKSWEEFEQVFLATQLESRNFATLCSLWGGCPREDAFERLRRISTKTIDESLLAEMVEVRLEALVEGDPLTASDVLFRLVLDRVHDELDAQDIWRHLVERNFRRRNLADDINVLAKLEEANARYLSPIRNELISGASIPREEARAALASLTSEDGRRGVCFPARPGLGRAVSCSRSWRNFVRKRSPS